MEYYLLLFLCKFVESHFILTFGFGQEVNVYLADSWRGSPKESEEMRPQWFNMDKLPFDMMWPDDRYWLGDALKGNYISASFLFDSNGNIKENNIGPKPKVRIR